MKNRLLMGVLLLCLAASAVFGADYNLGDTMDVNLAGIEEITFDLRGVSCSLCIRSLNIESEISGDRRGGEMTLSLSGSISSNREKAVPSLIIEEAGDGVTIRLYPRKKTFFGLSQTGRAEFRAEIPADFSGKVMVSGSSDDILVRDFSIEELDIRSSSGDLNARNLNADTIGLRVSSGDFRGDDITAGDKLSIDSSSGDVAIGRINAKDLLVEASSGDITVGEAVAENVLNVKASSGRIGIGTVSAGTADLKSSSGRVNIDIFDVRNGRIEVSSGDVRLDTVKAESMTLELSSGDLTVGELNAEKTDIKTSSDTEIASARGEISFRGSSGDVEIGLALLDAPVELDVSSGDITLSIPEGSAFDAILDTSSGKIRSEFPILGDLSADGDEMRGTVNGGGVTIDARTSSGDIKLLTN